MKVGIGIGNFSWPVTTDEIGSVISRIAVTADDLQLLAVGVVGQGDHHV